MLSDIEIAQAADILPINEIAAGLAISEEDLEPYGRYKAKLSEALYTKLAKQPDGKLILVTAINPTPAGEGKTTVSVGLAQALASLNSNPWLKHVDSDAQGYVVVTVTAAEVHAEMRKVNRLIGQAAPESLPVATRTHVRVAAGTPGVTVS